MSLEGVLKYPAVFIVGLAGSLLLTPFVLRRALRYGAVDPVAPRRLNRVPTPRGGGLAVVCAFHCASALVFFAPW